MNKLPSSEKIQQLVLDPIDIELAGIIYSLYVLEDHLKSIEADIDRLSKKAESNLKRDLEELKKQNLTQDEMGAESSLPYQSYDDHVDIQLPLLYRGSFIVMLYSAYESAITEIANFIKNNQDLSLYFSDIKGDLSTRIKKYFRYCLAVEVGSTGEWQALKDLTVVRNIYAHTGGRLDSLNEHTKSKLRTIIETRVDNDSNSEYLIVKPEFAQKMLNAVKTTIDLLVDKIKQQKQSSPDSANPRQ